MRRHIDLWCEKKADRFPAAIVIGAPPHVAYTAVTRVPHSFNLGRRAVRREHRLTAGTHVGYGPALELPHGNLLFW